MSAARTERLLNLLTLLLNSRRPVALREIRELDEFGAYRTTDPKSGERAFERDKAALVELGVPLRWIPPEQADDDEDGLGGYVIEGDKYFLPEIELSLADFALLSIAGSAAAGISGFPGRPAVIRALAKLGFDVDDESPAATVAHAPMLEGVDSKAVGAHLQELHDAVATRRSVTLVYRKSRDDVTERRVDPFGLYYRRGAWYLVAYCHLRETERTFHLARIQTLSPVKGDRHFDVPPDFALRAHVDRRPFEFPSAVAIPVRIRLADRLVAAIPEIFGPRAKVERKESGSEVSLLVTHRPAIIEALLPYGADAEVLEPADLREELRDLYRSLAETYSDAPPLDEGLLPAPTEANI
ncbi:MAG: WYL domain-containing protein [Myxococcota bacterium]